MESINTDICQAGASMVQSKLPAPACPVITLAGVSCYWLLQCHCLPCLCCFYSMLTPLPAYWLLIWVSWVKKDSYMVPCTCPSS